MPALCLLTPTLLPWCSRGRRRPAPRSAQDGDGHGLPRQMVRAAEGEAGLANRVQAEQHHQYPVHAHGPFFDIGQSRALPWKRRPRALGLMAALTDPRRGFNAVVIGEPQRAFYGSRFGNTFPHFTHYGVPLGVPEVGGAIDPDNEAHDLITSVFCGMSKDERNRTKIRVHSAMAAPAPMEGRFLGRPPALRLPARGPGPSSQPRQGRHRQASVRSGAQRGRCRHHGADLRRVPTWTGDLRHRREADPGTASPARPPTTRPATATATATANGTPGPGPRARSAPFSAAPATPAARSGTGSASTRACWTSRTSPWAIRP